MFLRPDIGVSYIPESSEGFAAVDDLIAFAFNITNTGSVTLSSIQLLSPTVRWMKVYNVVACRAP